MKLSNPFVLFGYEGPARDGCCAPSRRRGRCKLRSPASSSRGTAFSASSVKNGLGSKGDVLIAISTSGDSTNCLIAALVAHAKGIHIIALTGKDGGKLTPLSDVSIRVPETETFKIQELHLPIYHALCSDLEDALFN